MPARAPAARPFSLPGLDTRGVKEKNAGKEKRTVKKRLIALFMIGVAVAAGCTVFDKPFADPVGELSLIGEVFPLCKSGRAFYFGHVRNTGPLEIRDATAVVDVFGGSGNFLGRFSGPITESIEEIDIVLVDANGDPIVDPESENPIVVDTIIIPIDTLEVDENGSFSVETTVGCSTAASQELSFDFTIGVFTDEEL